MIDAGALISAALQATPPARRVAILKDLIAHAAGALQVIAGRQAAYESVDQTAAAIAAHASASEPDAPPEHGDALRSTPLTHENRLRTSQSTKSVRAP